MDVGGLGGFGRAILGQLHSLEAGQPGHQRIQGAMRVRGLGGAPQGQLAAHRIEVGDRPAGAQPRDSLVTQVGVRSAQALGVKDFFIGASSTDSNTPVALGVPAVTLGGGGIGGGSHSPGEWFSPLNAWRGPQNTLLAALALVGVDGVSAPLLPVLDRRTK